MSRRSLYGKYLLGICLGIVLYSEVFIYEIQPMFWPDLRCEDGQTCTKILFIADPQIQGEMAVPPPLSYLFNWDSDRYLRNTFQIVMRHFKPDFLVYLGDLMDEGSIATMPQFHHYAKRIFNIFETDKSVVQVWLPGDNDIGGENESIKQDKVAEFENIFKQSSVIVAKNTISFYKVNAIINQYPTEDFYDDDNYKIVVSHYPVTIRYMFAKKVNDHISPNIYFCAHNHESKYVKMASDLTNRKTHWFNEKGILEVANKENILYEIYVPTCSYRMGTRNIGFGAAVIDQSNTLRYTVFWSSERFPYLFVYLFLLIFIISYILVFIAAKLIYKKSSSCRYTSDSKPLLKY